MAIKARLVHETGVRASLRVYWGKVCTGPLGYHNAKRFLADSYTARDLIDTAREFAGVALDYPDWAFPTKCDCCGAEVPKDLPVSPPSPTWVEDSTVPERFRDIEVVHRQVFYDRLWSTETGALMPGDLYWANWYQNDAGKCYWHDENCDGRHLHAILPNGHEWDIDGRANNCTLPKDNVHRCWVRHGEPPDIHVDKNGVTCQAGAGSILNGDYHGFLHNGFFT